MNLLGVRDRLRLKRGETATARLQRWRQREQEGKRSKRTKVRQARLARLQRWCQREQEGKQSERTKVRQARLDRRSVHGEVSVVFSGSIGVELDSEGSIVSACTEH